MFNVDALIPNLTFNKPVEYNSKIILYPVKMENIYEFNLYKNVLKRYSIIYDFYKKCLLIN